MAEPHLSKAPSPSSSLPWLSSRQMVMVLFLASITMVFAATIAGYVFTRVNAVNFRAEGLPDLPRGLWWSTLLIALTSLSIARAQRAIKRNHLDAVRRSLYAASVLGALFLLTQAGNWFTMRPRVDAPSLYVATFYLITGVHALHVIGGFVPLGFVLFHAQRRDYSSSSHEGLSLCAQYWHYLGVVWLVLVGLLYVGS